MTFKDKKTIELKVLECLVYLRGDNSSIMEPEWSKNFGFYFERDEKALDILAEMLDGIKYPLSLP